EPSPRVRQEQSERQHREPPGRPEQSHFHDDGERDELREMRGLEQEETVALVELERPRNGYHIVEVLGQHGIGQERVEGEQHRAGSQDLSKELADAGNGDDESEAPEYAKRS